MVLRRHWDAFHMLTFLTRIRQASHYCARMLLHEVRVVHVELLDYLSPGSRQDLCGEYVLAVDLIVAKLRFWVQHAAKLTLVTHSIEDDFRANLRHLDVQLPYLSNLSDQVSYLDIDVDLDHDMHRLIIVHVVVAFCELRQVLLVSIRLAAVHALEISDVRVLN